MMQAMGAAATAATTTDDRQILHQCQQSTWTRAIRAWVWRSCMGNTYFLAAILVDLQGLAASAATGYGGVVVRWTAGYPLLAAGNHSSLFCLVVLVGWGVEGKAGSLAEVSALSMCPYMASGQRASQLCGLCRAGAAMTAATCHTSWRMQAQACRCVLSILACTTGYMVALTVSALSFC
jgi:hypothetical protein